MGGRGEKQRILEKKQENQWIFSSRYDTFELEGAMLPSSV